MNSRIQIIVAIVIIIALCVIINMIRRKALELRYALTWLCVGGIVLILDLFPGIMSVLSGGMGIEVPSNMLFFLGFCFSLAIALYMKREEKEEVKGEKTSDMVSDGCNGDN